MHQDGEVYLLIGGWLNTMIIDYKGDIHLPLNLWKTWQLQQRNYKNSIEKRMKLPTQLTLQDILTFGGCMIYMASTCVRT
jgi:hypothetical protein